MVGEAILLKIWSISCNQKEEQGLEKTFSPGYDKLTYIDL